VLREIREIGKVYLEERGFVFSMILQRGETEEEREEEREETPNTSSSQTQYLLTIDFDLTQRNACLKFVEMSRQICEDYLWVGNCTGNVAQNRLTTNKIDEPYLFFDALPNLKDALATRATQKRPANRR